MNHYHHRHQTKSDIIVVFFRSFLGLSSCNMTCWVFNARCHLAKLYWCNHGEAFDAWLRRLMLDQALFFFSFVRAAPNSYWPGALVKHIINVSLTPSQFFCGCCVLLLIVLAHCPIFMLLEQVPGSRSSSSLHIFTSLKLHFIWKELPLLHLIASSSCFFFRLWWSLFDMAKGKTILVKGSSCGYVYGLVWMKVVTFLFSLGLLLSWYCPWPTIWL